MKQLLFPSDIIGHIVKYLPVADRFKTVISLCPKIDTESVRKLINRHDDLDIFFEDITKAVPYFVDLMKITHTFLIGIRAFSYFHSIDVQPDCVWQFICPHNPKYRASFMYYLANNGVKWNKVNSTDKRRLRIDNRNEFVHVNTIDGHLFSNGRRLYIKLIWPMNNNFTIFEVLQTFGMTPLQCLVGGYQAVDPYGKLHAQHKYRLWGYPQDHSPDKVSPNLFTAMDYCRLSSIYPILFEDHRNHDPYKRFKRFIRGLTNDESLFREFKRHKEIRNKDIINLKAICILEDAYSLYLGTDDSEQYMRGDEPRIELLTDIEVVIMQVHTRCNEINQAYSHVCETLDVVQENIHESQIDGIIYDVIVKIN